ncbi:signal peptide protein [Rhodopirellula sallentina SM41]|uniref:Signal peptide protein n=2 Tax=Rhodopirellula TaxID=265488 RepID=M5U8Z8_9BACT|nr:signal peptide protein [Rhodopirellula sallentina SM41]
MIASTAVTAAPTASACCLTDWLYGRQPAYAVTPPPTVTVTPGTTVAPGTTVSPYAAGYTPYTAGYTPIVTAAAPNSAALPLAGKSIYAPASPYAVQRPAYGAVPLDNPSVYTGQPVMSGYRGAATAGNSIYGTGNVYPNNYASASPSVVNQPVTSYRMDTSSTVALPVQRTYPTPVRSGLARFFDSLLGTGYRTSYYTAPITYYRPATTVDPVTGTTVTVQQPCTSSVQQLQRTPYATLQPAPLASAPVTGSSCGADPVSGIDPCSAQSYGPIGSTYASPIPSTALPSSTLPGSTLPSGLSPIGGSSGLSGSNGLSGSGDLQPVSPPTLPPGSTYSGRPNYSMESIYSDSTSSFPNTNMSPLTGSSLGESSTFDSQDREPFPAPSLQSARPALSDSYESSGSRGSTANDAYRQGYEAGRAAMEKEAEARRDSQRESQYTPYGKSEGYSDSEGYGDSNEYGDSNNYDSSKDRESDQDADNSTPESYYQLAPPANQRPSTEETNQRSRWEIERDEQDLRELTTGVQRQRYGSQYASGTGASPSHVRPIPAPEDYRNPFDSTERLKAPDLLPALPPPTTQFNRNVDRSSGYSNEQRLSVPVREASVQGPQDRVPTRSQSERTYTSRQRQPAPAQPQTRSANDWQNKVRQQSKETGWYVND